jgi:dihydroneopterin aldolase
MARHDWIRIERIEVDCVVGVYRRERHVAQPLRVDLALCLDTERAAVRERLGDTINYEALAAQLRFLLTSCRFRMLETAAHALLRFVLAPPAAGERRAQVQRARITLTKPEALHGDGVPSLEVERDASWVSLGLEHKPFGTVDVVHETRDAGIYRLNLSPGGEIPLHIHKRMRESEMVLSSGLWCQGRPVTRGTVHRWPLEAAHGYRNPTTRWQTILCVDAPRFLEDDEIPVGGAPAEVRPESV